MELCELLVLAKEPDEEGAANCCSDDTYRQFDGCQILGNQIAEHEKDSPAPDGKDVDLLLPGRDNKPDQMGNDQADKANDACIGDIDADHNGTKDKDLLSDARNVYAHAAGIEITAADDLQTSRTKIKIYQQNQ